MGIRSVASRQRGTQKEQEFSVDAFKGLAPLPKSDRRPETRCQFIYLYIFTYFLCGTKKKTAALLVRKDHRTVFVHGGDLLDTQPPF